METDVLRGLGGATSIGGVTSDANDWLTTSELSERLRIATPELVAEIHALQLRRLDADVARLGRIDAKCISLLSGSGLSVSVATVALTLVKEHGLPSVGMLCFIVAFVFGVLAGVLSMFALKVRKAGTSISDTTLFNARALSTADNEDDAAIAVASYRRFILVAYWEVQKNVSALIDKKAVYLQLGQMALVFFMFFVATALSTLAWGIK